MPTDTPTTTDTVTPAPTMASTGNPSIYQYATIPASGQTTAIVYSVSAGEAGIAAINLAMLMVLLFICFLMIARSRNGQ